jgi:endonuclease YncB( thermonuclease family)
MTGASGTMWDVDRIERVGDGDTLRLYRSRLEQIGDHWYRITEVNPDGAPRTVSIRLVWVDTPERGKPGWHEARDDLVKWASTAALGPIRVICYESAGWDRILGDLIDSAGQSASQWLMAACGWPAYAP